jgi:dTDP-4-dehydrorhamnose 3,5-epimerase-like enzyme
MYNSAMEPQIIDGSAFCDDRGFVKFINDFEIGKYRRFYLVENHRQGFIRAWHGHLHEQKAVICVKGEALIGLVKLNFDPDSETDEIHKFAVSATMPKAIIIPAGFANGFKSLSADCTLMYFSSATIEEAKLDDIRFPYDKWNVWEESYR